MIWSRRCGDLEIGGVSATAWSATGIAHNARKSDFDARTDDAVHIEPDWATDFEVDQRTSW